MFYLIKSLRQIIDNVFHMLDTNWQKDQTRYNARWSLFFIRQLLVGGRCRMDNQGFWIADVRKMAYQVEAIDKQIGCLCSPFDMKLKMLEEGTGVLETHSCSWRKTIATTATGNQRLGSGDQEWTICWNWIHWYFLLTGTNIWTNYELKHTCFPVFLKIFITL